jgi:hypothetical protein
VTENCYHYLFSGGETATDFNAQMFKYGQQPTSWVLKGIRLRRDAAVFYEASESARLFVVSELEKINFSFSRFYRWQLQDGITQILSNYQDRYLPDFDTYYLVMHLSLENVLKGIWLDTFPENIGFDKLPRALNTHDLIRLADDVGLELSAQQQSLFSKLAELFLGYSRYPIKNRVKQAAGPQDWDFGERNYDAVCIDCLNNPYSKEKKALDTLWAERLQEKIDRVFEHSHERMLSTFDFRESPEPCQPQETKSE